MKSKEHVVNQALVNHFIKSFQNRLHYSIGRDINSTYPGDRFKAMAYAIRDEMIDKWLHTQVHYYKANPKRVYYLSLEYLMGRTLGNAVMNLGMQEVVSEGLKKIKQDLINSGHEQIARHFEDLEDLEDLEVDAGLGNGGLGRLAACFLDSMATMELPAYGYGIRYEYGMFEQRIENHAQIEYPDNWLSKGTPWELARDEVQEEYKVYFKGHVHAPPGTPNYAPKIWQPDETVVAVCYDHPVPGFEVETVNSLKLWSARSSKDFNLSHFNAGDYTGAIVEKHQSEVISKVLYPNDQNIKGKELRLMQQYFMVSASLQDILVRLERCGDALEDLPLKAAVQLNDTHPSIAIVELMRILIDDKHWDWEKAWDITTHTFAYTNHTVLPEALEKWPVPMLEYILPRHMELIYEINQRFLDKVSVTFPADWDRRSRMSIIAEGQEKQVRMAHLAIVGSYSVNGVAELHSRLLKSGIFKDFYEIFPSKFNNKTNGITPRRWLKHANPLLSDLITSHIGPSWVKDLSELSKLEPLVKDAQFRAAWAEVKQKNKERLEKVIVEQCRIRVNVSSIFDVQVKRIHEYKRQLLNLLHVIYLYNQLRSGKLKDFIPRTVIFAGKAAPGYKLAKDIIALISRVSHQISHELLVQKYLSVVFLPNYGVSLAEKIFPGSDLSEQISTAGMEASGTGNMKFALNGSLTIGTLDGANVEMQEEFGAENIFIFGNTTEQIQELWARGYNPRHYYETDPDLKQVLDQIANGFFSPSDPSHFKPIVDRLLNGDPFCVLADFRAYVECQARVTETYRDQDLWTQMSILNVARMAKFSSDRTIKQYAEEIWQVSPSPVIRAGGDKT